MDKLNLQDKKVAILGIGTEGLALSQFLYGKTKSLTILDKLTKEEVLERLEGKEKEQFEKINSNLVINKVLGSAYLDNLNEFDIIFRSPGIPLNDELEEAKSAGTSISSQIKLFFDLCPCQIIGVTGTKGKGTTSSLIYEIMKRQNSRKVFIAGNIGYPAITLIPNLSENDAVILELSSFQLIDLEKSPHISVVTNLSEDHLDYHKDVAEYRTAKFNILKFQKEDDFAVLNSDSTFSEELLDGVKSKKRFFSKSNSADAIVSSANEVILEPRGRNINICNQSEIKLFGLHNLENIAAAAMAADLLGIDSELIKNSVREFTGLPHRLEFVAEINDVKYINDSYATNPEPTMAAIDSFREPKILILGGSSKGADFSLLADKVTGSNVRAVILIGLEGERIKEALLNKEYLGKIIENCKNIDEVVSSASSEAKAGEVVILSPACASFGMFKNYKKRGEEFKAAVLNLEK